jgi:c-di-GMP-binding flagellar brake protein YcgR
MEDNRRRFPRINVGVSGLIYPDGNKQNCVPCEILDLSLGGAFIHCTAPILIGQEIMVEIHFETNTLLNAKVVRDPNDVVKLAEPEKSIVRWVRGSSKSGFGVEFQDLGDAKKTYLQRLIVHFEQMRAAKTKSK